MLIRRMPRPSRPTSSRRCRASAYVRPTFARPRSARRSRFPPLIARRTRPPSSRCGACRSRGRRRGRARAGARRVRRRRLDRALRATRARGGVVDFVDEVAAHLVGRALARDPKALWPVMDRWIDDEDLWIRHTAMYLCQLTFKGSTDERRLFRYCLRRAAEAQVLHPEGDRLGTAAVRVDEAGCGARVSLGTRRRALRAEPSRGGEESRVGSATPCGVGVLFWWHRGFRRGRSRDRTRIRSPIVTPARNLRAAARERLGHLNRRRFDGRLRRRVEPVHSRRLAWNIRRPIGPLSCRRTS